MRKSCRLWEIVNNNRSRTVSCLFSLLRCDKENCEKAKSIERENAPASIFFSKTCKQVQQKTGKFFFQNCWCGRNWSTDWEYSGDVCLDISGGFSFYISLTRNFLEIKLYPALLNSETNKDAKTTPPPKKKKKKKKIPQESGCPVVRNQRKTTNCPELKMFPNAAIFGWGDEDAIVSFLEQFTVN